MDVEKSNFEGEQPSHEEVVKLESEFKEIRWSKNGETKLRGGYKKRSHATLTRKKHQLKN